MRVTWTKIRIRTFSVFLLLDLTKRRKWMSIWKWTVNEQKTRA